MKQRVNILCSSTRRHVTTKRNDISKKSVIFLSLTFETLSRDVIISQGT